MSRSRPPSGSPRRRRRRQARGWRRRRGRPRAGRRWSCRRARACRCRARRRGRARRRRRSGTPARRPTAATAPPHHGADPELADVVHEEARDPALGLPGELGLAGPVAAQADLDVAHRVDLPPPRRGGTSASRARPRRRRPRCRCRCGCRSGRGRPGRARPRRRGCRARRSSGRRRARSAMTPAASTSPTVASIAWCVLTGSAGSTGASPKSTIRSSGESVDLRLEVRAGRAARGADRARPEARPRAVGDEVVGRRADDRDVEPGELGRVLRVRQAAEREQARVVGLLAVLPPALERIDHARLSQVDGLGSPGRWRRAAARRWRPARAGRRRSRPRSARPAAAPGRRAGSWRSTRTRCARERPRRRPAPPRRGTPRAADRDLVAERRGGGTSGAAPGSLSRFDDLVDVASRRSDGG